MLFSELIKKQAVSFHFGQLPPVLLAQRGFNSSIVNQNDSLFFDRFLAYPKPKINMLMKNVLSIICFSLCVVTITQAQITEESANKIPKVFKLGEDESTYDELVKGYPLSLLEATNNDVKGAFNKWIQVLEEMENYSEKIRYNIKGLKLRLHVFWNESGNIDHIGYLLREDSRNVNDAELKAFLKSFVGRSKMDITAMRKYSFYTTATFPVYVERYTENK